MQRQDLLQLANRLAELAEVLPPHRAPSEKGVLVWFDALSTFSTAEVLGAITDWPRIRAKMPVPSELVALLNERRSDRIETEAAKAARAPGFRVEKLSSPTAVGRVYMAKIRQILGSGKPGPRAWILVLARREAAGEQISLAAAQTWRSAAGVPADTPAANFAHGGTRPAVITQDLRHVCAEAFA